MAYNPKSYLDQALKTGFTSHYSQPVSRETQDEPQYEGDWATLGNVTVVPLSEPVYEGTGDAQYQSGSTPSGHMVSVPLTGKYEGYSRNDIYDNDGNFVKTTISEPDNDKYGLKSLAQLGLTAASFGGLGPLAQGLASAYKGVNAAKSGDWLSAAASILPNAGLIPGVDKGLADTLKTAGGYAKTASTLQKAIESKDPLAILSALPGTPGIPQIPSDITDVLKGVGQAKQIREAVRNEDPYALLQSIVGASKAGGKAGKGYFPGYDTPGEIQEGFFDVGGPGYMEPEGEDADSYIRSLMNFESGFPQDMSTGGGDLPDWALDPDGTTSDPYYSSDPSQEKYVDEDRLLGKYPAPAGDVEPAGPRTKMDPMELNRFLEANIDDPATIADLLDLYNPQQINVTGTKDTTSSDAVTTPRSIRDVDTVTKINPDEKLEGTEIKEPDLSKDLPGVGGTKTTGTKTTAKPGMSPEDVMKLLLAMQGQRPEQEEDYRLFAGQPLGYDLMYGLRG